jgi:hypothetical protein
MRNHDPCHEVQVAAEDAKEALSESRAARLDLASIKGSLTEIKWWNRGLVALLIGLGSWLFARSEAQAQKLTECCVSAQRTEQIESQIHELLEQARRTSVALSQSSP